jgi:hypothetical protein
MKRYLVFVGYDYYPQGGMHDFIRDYDTIEEARAGCYDHQEDVGMWGHIFDQQEETLIE